MKFVEGLVSRREFLLGALVVGSMLIKDPVTDFALSVPQVNDPTGNFAGYDLYPGWIEAGTKSPFIQRDKGHLHWLREIVFENEAVLKTSRKFFNYLLENQSNNQRVDLGTSLFYAIQYGGHTLNDLGFTKIHPDISIRLEAIRLGLFAFAAGYITWFRREDYRKLGASIEDSKSVVSYFWNSQKGLGAKVFPRLFGLSDEEAAKYPFEEDKEPRFTGEDRVLHFSQHLLLGFEYLYSKRFDLKEHRRMPVILSKALNLNLLERSLEDRVRLFSRLLGIFYEISRTDLLEGLTKESKYIHEGIFDLMVYPDYKANDLGVESAIALWGRIMEDIPITRILTALDDPGLRDINASPTLIYQ